MPNKRKRRQNKNRQAQFKEYEKRAELNKLRKQERHKKKHPRDI